MKRTRFTHLSPGIIALLALGCHVPPNEGDSPEPHAAHVGIQSPSSAPGFETRSCPKPVRTEDGWTCTQIDAAPPVALPGGQFQPEPTCLEDEPFGFFSRFDPSNKNLIIHLQAGGHCIGDQCAAWIDARGRAAASAPLNGIFELDNPDNPFADYNQVRIPYCSGDTHAGHVTLSGGEVDGWKQHGFDNVVSTLAYLHETYGEQLRGGRVVFAGSSAGGVATIVDSPLLPLFFPDSEIAVLSDSAAGVQSCYDTTSSYDAWQLGSTLALMGIERAPSCSLATDPSAPPATALSGFLPGLWADNIAAHPDWSFAYIGAHHDKSQSTMALSDDFEVCAQCTFANAVASMIDCAGGDAGADCSFASAQALSTFVYPHTQHTILASDSVYDRKWVAGPDGEIGQVSAAEWLAQWLEGPASYACEGCADSSDCSACGYVPCACPDALECPGASDCPAAIDG